MRFLHWCPQWDPYVITDNGERFLYMSEKDRLAELYKVWSAMQRDFEREYLMLCEMEPGQRAN